MLVIFSAAEPAGPLTGRGQAGISCSQRHPSSRAAHRRCLLSDVAAACPLHTAGFARTLAVKDALQGRVDDGPTRALAGCFQGTAFRQEPLAGVVWDDIRIRGL